MTAGVEKLLERRLLIVTGKGGTGKTSVAASLASVAAQRGIDCVLVETAGSSELAELICDGPPPPGDGREPVRISRHLFFLRIDPETALREYLELQLRARPLVPIVMRTPGFRSLLAAAPGWRELITLGKLWHLETRVANGRPRWGLLVVDAPSTGHGLSFLSVPKVVVGTVRLGPLHRHTLAVQELLTDSARTLIVSVTLPEELPVRETLELAARIAELGLAAGPVIANAIEPHPCSAAAAPVLAALGALGPPRGPGGGGPLFEVGALQSAVENAARRAEQQRAFLAELRHQLEVPVLELPFLTEGVRGPTQVAELARHLEAELEPGAPD